MSFKSKVLIIKLMVVVMLVVTGEACEFDKANINWLQFTRNLFSALTLQVGNQNALVSPISNFQTLNLVLAGISNKSSLAATELIETLGTYETQNSLGNVLVNVANRPYNRPNNQTYITDNKKYGNWPKMQIFNSLHVGEAVSLLTEYEAEIRRICDKSSLNIIYDSPIVNPSAVLLWSIIKTRDLFWSNPQDGLVESQEEVVFYQNGNPNEPVTGTLLSGSFVYEAKQLVLGFNVVDDDDHDDYDAYGDVNGVKLSEPMEKQLGKNNAKNKWENKFRIIEIPLNGGFKFIIFEPMVTDPFGLNQLSELTNWLMSGDNLAKSLLQLDENQVEREIKFSIGRFGMGDTHEMISVFKSMGINEVFDSNKKSIDAMVKRQDGVYISTLNHLVQFSLTGSGVNLVGGDTSGIIQSRAAQEDNDNFINVDISRPFMYMLRRTAGGLPLFMGQMYRFPN